MLYDDDSNCDNNDDNNDDSNEQVNKSIDLNIYQKYKHALSTTIKSELVYRENEAKEIKEFIQTHLINKKSSSIYISGPPGTGKLI